MDEEQAFRQQFQERREQGKRARKVLGVGKNTGLAEIRRAFRKLAKKHHPDVNPRNKKALAKFKTELNAYRFLIGKTDSFTATPDERGETDKTNMKLGEFANNELGHYGWYVDSFMTDFLGLRHRTSKNTKK